MSANYPVIRSILGWLRMHTSGIKLRYDALDSETDLGYIKACECIHAEITRLLEELKEDEDTEL